VSHRPEDGDDALKEGVGRGGVLQGVLQGDVAPGGGEGQSGAHLGGAARGYPIQVEAVATRALPTLAKAPGHRAGGTANLPA
jgi:hypothetical protein